MLYTLGLGHDVVIHGPLRVWAERGLIHFEDSRDNTYNTATVRDVLERVKAINDMIGNSTNTGGMVERAGKTRRYYQRLVEQYVDLCHKAREQGMPSDEGARRAAVRSLPRSVSVPASFNF